MRFLIACLLVLLLVDAVFPAPQHQHLRQAQSSDLHEYLVNDKRSYRQKRWYNWWGFGGPLGFGFGGWGLPLFWG